MLEWLRKKEPCQSGLTYLFAKEVGGLITPSRVRIPPAPQSVFSIERLVCLRFIKMTKSI